MSKHTLKARIYLTSLISAILLIAFAYLLLSGTRLLMKDYLSPISPRGAKIITPFNSETNCTLQEFSSKKIGQSKSNNGYEIQAYTPSTMYAKIGNNASLFKTDNVTDTSVDNIIMILPATYFVEIISMQNSALAYVNYYGINGYVKMSDIIKVNFAPTTPFLTGVIITLKTDYDTYIRSSPKLQDDNANILKLIPRTTTGITYLGEVNGEKPSDGNSNIWYYCIFEEGPTRVHVGYVYSERVASVSPFVLNAETPEIVLPPAEVQDTESPLADDTYIMNKSVKWILITLLTLPTILVFVLLIKKPKSHINNVAFAEVSEEFIPDNVDINKSKKIKPTIFEAEYKQDKIIQNNENKVNKTPLKNKTINLKNSSGKTIHKNKQDTKKQTQKTSQVSNLTQQKNFMERFFETTAPHYPDDDELL